MVFSRFKERFHEMPHRSDETLSYLDNSSVASDAQDLSLVTEQQQKTDALAECLLYVENVDKSRSFKFRRPGALHNAHWMKKILYATKVILLQKQISLMPKGTITTQLNS